VEAVDVHQPQHDAARHHPWPGQHIKWPIDQSQLGKGGIRRKADDVPRRESIRAAREAPSN
jgi:hypothetical protein